MTNNILETRNLVQTFGTSEKPIRVLKSVDLSIPRGSFTIIYGPSGSGKSTLLNSLMGLQPPSGGTVLFKGDDLYAKTKDELALHRSRNVSTVYQTNYWVKSLTVLENVALPLYFQDMDRTSAGKLALAKLSELGMERHAGTLPSVLSGGEQQRIAMARALVTNAEVIVADEPTGNLDTANGDMIVRLLKKSQEDMGKTVILVTHELEYLSLGDRLFHIEDGLVSSVAGKDIQAATGDIFQHIQERINTLMKPSHV